MRKGPFKMRGFSGFKSSPLQVEGEEVAPVEVKSKKTFDYSKKADYSKEKISTNFGSRIAKAFTPENTPVGVATAMLPVHKAVKFGKGVYNYFKQNKA